MMDKKTNITLLNSQYQKIKKQCIVKFFSFAGQVGADVFPRVNIFCQKLLKRNLNLISLMHQQDRFKSNMCLDEDNPACDFVQASYSGFWDFGNEDDEDFKKDRFLVQHQHVYLLDWSENANPYAELQRLSQAFIHEKFSMKDISFIFKSFLTILDEDVSPQETIQSIRDLLKEFFPDEAESILQ